MRHHRPGLAEPGADSAHALGVYQNSGSSALLLVAGVIGLFSLVVPGLWGFVEGVFGGYRTRVPNAK